MHRIIKVMSNTYHVTKNITNVSNRKPITFDSIFHDLIIFNMKSKNFWKVCKQSIEKFFRHQFVLLQGCVKQVIQHFQFPNMSSLGVEEF